MKTSLRNSNLDSTNYRFNCSDTCIWRATQPKYRYTRINSDNHIETAIRNEWNYSLKLRSTSIRTKTTTKTITDNDFKNFNAKISTLHQKLKFQRYKHNYNSEWDYSKCSSIETLTLPQSTVMGTTQQLPYFPVEHKCLLCVRIHANRSDAPLLLW